mmetsp:Transcript_32074/g.76227  ORF Transcript_32074/g.76227 Transcript_32074/m.76227 type:complete len:412 (-) Transcript_32074:512-1747(-)
MEKRHDNKDNEEWREWEDSVLLLEQNKPKAQTAPWYSWPFLAVGILAVSSAPVVFRSMPEVPPVNLAAWRLQLTSVLLIPLAMFEWRRMSADKRRSTMLSGWILAASGACLAVHFGAFVWGIQNTSLPHSLFMVSTTPIVLSAGALCLRKPISNGELLGTCLGVAGAIVLAVGAEASSDDSPTLKGDLASFVGAIAIAGYLSAGGKLREWMPLFVYAATVTAVAAVLLMISAMVGESTGLFASGTGGAFGWIASHYWWKVVYLAAVPGVLGHTVFNSLLKWMSPLVIGISLMLEPVVGSFMGWAVGVSDAPSVSAWLGGFFMFLATVTVTISSHYRQRRAQAKQDASQALSRVFADSDVDEVLGVGPRNAATELTARQPWPREGVRAGAGQEESGALPAIEVERFPSQRSP